MVAREQLGTSAATGDERHARHALVALAVRDADRAELRRARAVRAAARREVVVADRDDADVARDFGIAAQLQRGELGGVGEPRADRQIVVDEVVRELLGGGELGVGNAIARDVDRQRGLAEARGCGRGLRAIEQRARQ